MSYEVDKIFNELSTLSDNADGVIKEDDFGHDQVAQWFASVKDTANAIVKGTNFKPFLGTERSSLSFTKEDVPSLKEIITLIKGKQNAHKSTVSTWMAEVQKDRVKHSYRKSRKSLRKIVLGKKSGNKWQISNRQSSIAKIEETSNVTQDSEANNRLSEFQNSVGNAEAKNDEKSYCDDIDTSIVKQEIDITTPVHKQPINKASATPINKQVAATPIQNHEILAPNTDEKTPVTRSKAKLMVAATQIIKLKNKNTPQSSELSRLTKTSTYGRNTGKLSNYQKSNSVKPSASTDNESYFTPENKTVVIDSDCSTSGKHSNITPKTRFKRKSSAQHSQENAKKIKNVSSASEAPNDQRARCKRKDKYPESSNKRTRAAKEVTSVIPPKVSNDLSKQNQMQSEKRILKEIQKKEEKVNQNAKKIRSLREMKIEENKKARELKMEKAMQQRMKIEKEKEERVRSRTQSKQENIQQKEPASKKVVAKKVDASSLKNNLSSYVESLQKHLLSPTKKASPVVYGSSSQKIALGVNEPSPKEVIKSNANQLNATYVRSPPEVEKITTVLSASEKAPPKPIRKPATPIKTPLSEPPVESEKVFVKPSDNLKTDKCVASSPVLKKVGSKTNLAKTPVSNSTKKPNSYAMTPHESSFVSYDISQIHSDDSDEEETSNNKPIPSWASGAQLKNALMTQHYSQIDTVELFGNVFEPPDLAKIMGTQKKHYNKRTSSAVWLDSPNRSILA